MVSERPLARHIVGDNSRDHHSWSNDLQGESIDMFLMGEKGGVYWYSLSHIVHKQRRCWVHIVLLGLTGKTCFVKPCGLTPKWTVSDLVSQGAYH